ncbi:type II toxin-antitoxin system RelE/ParE family toxin [uncultured Nitratireductor sp.]|uniref:type II toxin-antitoxin system RelE/ParE family toxin n=1 Tax=uncultured Nitratireductor sp. TaxID=520953 RepID=UPI0026282362|nr:type II toxin-antitoxin system RelE/ParE family toxin [uncultured Nitratireductor sp.]
MYSIKKTRVFIDWINGLKDRRAAARIAVRIDRFQSGNPGQVRELGEGVSEMKIDHGPGYRVYYVRRGKTVYLLLCGGDKRSQTKDIAEAKRLAKEVTNDQD